MQDYRYKNLKNLYVRCKIVRFCMSFPNMKEAGLYDPASFIM